MRHYIWQDCPGQLLQKMNFLDPFWYFCCIVSYSYLSLANQVLFKCMSFRKQNQSCSLFGPFLQMHSHHDRRSWCVSCAWLVAPSQFTFGHWIMIGEKIEVKLPTIWENEASEVGRAREEKGRRKKSEKRKFSEKESEERRARRAKR